MSGIVRWRAGVHVRVLGRAEAAYPGAQAAGHVHALRHTEEQVPVRLDVHHAPYAVHGLNIETQYPPARHVHAVRTLKNQFPYVALVLDVRCCACLLLWVKYIGLVSLAMADNASVSVFLCRYMWTASFDKTIKVIDAKSRKTKYSLTGHTDAITCLVNGG